MGDSKGNIDKIKDQIVCTTLLYDKEYNDANSDVAKRKLLYVQTMEKVEENISKITASILERIPKNVSKPENIHIEVARRMLNEVQNSHEIVDIGFILDEKDFMKTLGIPIQEEKSRQTDFYKVNNNSKIPINNLKEQKNEFIKNGVFKLSNGLLINYVDIEDSRFACSRDEAAEDMEILYHENDINIVFESYKNNGNDVNKSLELLDTIVNLNNGRDAALMYFNRQIEIDGIEFITQNELGKAFFKKMSEILKNDRETGTGIKDDNYTIFSKMELFSRVRKAFKEGKIDLENFKDYEKQMKDMDFQLYEIIEKNPSMLEVIQIEYFEENDINSNNSQELAIKFFGKSEAVSREDTLEGLTEYAKNNPKCQQEPTGNVLHPKGKEFIIEPAKKIPYIPPETSKKTPRDIIELNKRLLCKCYERNGIEGTLRAAFKNSTASQMSTKSKNAWMEAVSEILDLEKIGTEESIIRNENDFTALKEHLKEICKEEDSHTYATKVGNAVKNISENERNTSLFKVEPVEIIVGRFAENTDRFNGSQNSKNDNDLEER